MRNLRLFRATLVGLYLVGTSSAFLSGCGGGSEDDAPPTPVITTSYRVTFSQEQVISGNAATGAVTASANLSTGVGDDITANGSVSVDGASATTVTINSGYAGEAGSVVVSLTSSNGASWNIPAGTLLDQVDLDRLQDTGFHVVIETPSGRLRGQILPPEWQVVMADLTSDATVPFSGTAGTGKAGITYHPTRGALRIRTSTSGVSNVIGASLRIAIAGAIGNVETTLEQSLSDANVWGTIDVNNAGSGIRLSQSGLDQIERGEFHLTVDTATHPSGALRGQILTSGVAIYETALTDTEVVTSGAPIVSNGEATAIVTYKAATRDFGLALNTDLLNATDVYVQLAPAGEIGGVLFMLMPDSRVPGNWFMSPGSLVTDIAEALENEEFYVSVYTPSFPEGELRGQISLR